MHLKMNAPVYLNSNCFGNKQILEVWYPEKALMHDIQMLVR